MPIDAGVTETLAAVKLLSDLVGKFAKSNDVTADIKQLNGELVVIQTHALSALNEAKFLAARNRDLEKENSTFKDWSTEAAQYAPLEISLGIFVHARKDAVGAMKSMQKLCSNCFNQGQKSLLQYQAVEVGRNRSLVCHRCDKTVVFHSYLDTP